MRHDRWFYVQMVWKQLDACGLTTKKVGLVGPQIFYTNTVGRKRVQPTLRVWSWQDILVQLQRVNTVQVQIAIATSNGREFKRMKVNEAFRHGGVDNGNLLEKATWYWWSSGASTVSMENFSQFQMGTQCNNGRSQRWWGVLKLSLTKDTHQRSWAGCAT